MAKAVSDEELQLKKRARRRLVGAIVLVTAVAVVLPMVLDSEPRPSSQSINIQIPSPDAGVLSAKPAPLKPADVPAPAAAETPKVETKAETKPAPKPETAAEARPESKPAPVAKAEAVAPAAKAEAPAKTKDSTKTGEAAKSAGSFVIQVAALSDAARAKELQAKITAGGMKAYTEVVQTAKGPVTRVRVGPYTSRESAEKARSQLQKLQLDGKVVPR
ncbi:MAG: SPOR domain-containing protein [Burkholderiales bacterium]|nr:SPOR domain-containing protein [Burkholderiales bacterium]